jgi:aquaporin Z
MSSRPLSRGNVDDIDIEIKIDEEVVVTDKPPAYNTVAKLAAEFIGTFALVFTACNNNASHSELGSISVACSLMVGIYALGSVSGGHFNPAVTLGVYLNSILIKAPLIAQEVALYLLVQLVAGLCAGLASGGLWNDNIFGTGSGQLNATTLIHYSTMTNATYSPLGVNLEGGAEYGYGIIFVAEMVYTCVLVFVVLNVATCNDTKGPNHYFGLAIGFVIVAGATAIGSISGCSLNPAVSFGVAMNAVPFGEDVPFVAFLYYTFCELVGAVFAFLLFGVCRAKFKFVNGGKIWWPSKLVAECWGTFVLTLTVCLVVSQGAKAPIVGLIGIASSLMVSIYALGAVSGANFNPAVSMALMVIKELHPYHFAAYVVVQIVGGLSALGVAIFLRQGEWNVAIVTGDRAAILNGVSEAQGSWAAILGAEFFYTLLLAFVVLNVAVRDAGNQYYGLAIGFTIIAGGAAVGGLSGGVFNPAISIALDIGGTRTEGTPYGYGWLYVLIELVAGAAAAGLYKLISLKESGDDVDEEEASSSGES